RWSCYSSGGAALFPGSNYVAALLIWCFSVKKPPFGSFSRLGSFEAVSLYGQVKSRHGSPAFVANFQCSGLECLASKVAALTFCCHCCLFFASIVVAELECFVFSHCCHILLLIMHLLANSEQGGLASAPCFAMESQWCCCSDSRLLFAVALLMWSLLIWYVAFGICSSNSALHVRSMVPPWL
ncbi:hypothetical protein U1Q18_012513, partial [Sarracenia purpurea var. burkii]